MADDETRDVAMAVFMSLCPGATVHQAQALLERHEWDAEVAAAEYVKAATAGVPSSSGNNNNSNKTSSTTSTSAPQPVYITANNNKSNNNKKPETYYAGGASSGMAIMNPNDNDEDDEDNNKGQGNDFLKALFESAKAAGGVEKQGLPGSNNTNDGHVQFGGVGRRLGYTEGGQTPASAPVVKPEKKVILTTYKNGYVLGDESSTTSAASGEGELRPYDEKGKRFMTVISKGFLPPELSAMYPGAELSIALVDRSKEDYVQKWKPFSGQGHKLQDDNNMNVNHSNSNNSSKNIPPPTSFELREDEKKAKVALLLPSGSRVEREVNPDRHTVNDIRYLAAEAINSSSGNNTTVTPQSVSLTVRTLPPRPLHSLTDTIAAAKASGCVILVKIQ